MDQAPLSPTEFASAVTAITSAFGDPSRRAIYLFAHEHLDGVTAAETAERFALHPNVARHHLDKLSSAGHLEVTTGPAAERVSLDVPVRQDDVLITLLGRALAMLPREAAERMAEEVGIEYGLTMAKAMGDSSDTTRSFRAALHVVADALTAHGFAAHAEKHNGMLRIVSENCPFGDTVVQNPVICAVDRGMVKGMLSALVGHSETDLQSSLPMGDDVCITNVSA